MSLHSQSTNKFNVRTVLYVLFFFSGFSGLIYESIWTHYMKLFLGSAAYAQTLVLIIFMGGMAVGAWAMGKYSARVSDLILGYAVVEGVIGLLAIIFHWIFAGAMDLSYFTIIPRLHSPVLLMIYKWGLSSLLILPQTILLGATFPLMSAGILRLYSDKPGKTLATLYFSNSLGAVVGVLTSGYVLIGLAGLPGTVRIAGYMNILIAVGAWLIRRSYLPAVAAHKIESTETPSERLVLLFVACSFFTGLASFMYEIGWIRMLSLVLGSSTHAFELMLSAFILGLAIGGYWIKKRIDGLNDPIRALGIIQVSMGCFALLTLFLYGGIFNLMGYFVNALAKSPQGYILYNLFSQAIAWIIMLPATICAGMTLPIITYYLLKKGYGEGAIGKVYAWNTLGAIIGVLLAIHFIMPVMGLKYVVLIGAIVDAGLGLVLLRYADIKLISRSFVVAVCISVVFVLSSIVWELDVSKMASGVFRTGKLKQEANEEIVFHRDGKTASVDVGRREKHYFISTNGKPDGSVGIGENVTSDEATQTLAGAFAIATNEKAKTAAVIGLGTGMTGCVMLSSSSLQSLDIVEIEPAIIEGARMLGPRVTRVFNDPRSRIYIDDAKAFFTNRNKKYDIILSEPSNPWVSGVASLFSKEFYRIARHYLEKDGVLVQWIHLYELSTPLIASVMQALSESFPDYALYAADDGNIIIMAGEGVSKRELKEDLFHNPAMTESLNRIQVFNIRDLTVRYLGGKNILDPLFQSYPVQANSDFFPVLDLNAVRERYLQSSAFELIASLRGAPVPLLETLGADKQPFNNLAVTNSIYYTPSQDVRQAYAVLNQFGGRFTAQGPLVMNAESAGLVISAKNPSAQCSSDDILTTWIPDMLKLISITAPYAQPSHMQSVWGEIERSRCYAGTSSTAREWLNVYKAVSLRDYRKAAEHSDRILSYQKGEITPSMPNNYLMIVGLWSHLALGEKKEAAELAGRYNNPNPPVVIRLLSALANGR